MVRLLSPIFRYLCVILGVICFIVIIPPILVVSMIRDRYRDPKTINDYLGVVECYRCRRYCSVDRNITDDIVPIFCAICVRVQERRTG
jgi:hypothetical protein